MTCINGCVSWLQSEGFHDVLAAVMNVGRADVVEQLLSLFVLPDPDSYDDYSYLVRYPSEHAS